jgi:hypothetical protein
MKAQDFKLLMAKLIAAQSRGDAWLDKVPSDISAAFFDNDLVDSLYQANSALKDALFESPLNQEVDWFLYEWEATKPETLRTITYPDGTTYVINNLDDFVTYLINEGLLT